MRINYYWDLRAGNEVPESRPLQKILDAKQVLAKAHLLQSEAKCPKQRPQVFRHGREDRARALNAGKYGL